MKRILVIDDVVASAEAIASSITDTLEGVQCEIETDFDKAVERIAVVRPDAIVLDLMETAFSENLSGATTWKSVWDGAFCPIVIYSASEAALEPRVPSDHSCVRRIKKDGKSGPILIEALKGFMPAVEAMNALRTEIEAVIHKVLRDTVGEGHMPMGDASYLLHAGRRRIAATMDEPTIIGNRVMASWEVYLVPAIGPDCLTGDILFKRGESRGSPESYRLMLSPSCDLARGGKVPDALVAKCYPPAMMLAKFRVAAEPSDEKDLKKQLTSLVLSQGTWNGWVPLPAFASTLPVCAANLKHLQLIPLTAIGPAESTTHEFVRIASIDSPFREQVAWAYLTTAARPGMPDRELKPWVEEFVKAAASAPAAGAPAKPR